MTMNNTITLRLERGDEDLCLAANHIERLRLAHKKGKTVRLPLGVRRFCLPASIGLCARSKI